MIIALIGILSYRGIQSGSIHLYFSQDPDEKLIEEIDYSKYSSGDIRFNTNGQGSSYLMPITIEKNSSKIYAYADRKSFGFPNEKIVISLYDSKSNLIGNCVVTSGKLCDFKKLSITYWEDDGLNVVNENQEKLKLPVGDNSLHFTSPVKHTWELWVKVE